MSKTTARIILTAALIPGAPSTTTSLEIKQRLEQDGFNISERQVQRDLKSIHEAMPDDLVCKREKGMKDRWFWDSNARLGSLTGRSMSEALALTSLAGSHGQLVPDSILANLKEPMERARKFLSFTPLPHVRHWHDKLVSIHGPIYRIQPEVDPEVAATVTEAVYAERQLKICRRGVKGSGDREDDSVIDPMGLLTRNNLTYLITASNDLIPLHSIEAAKMLTTSASNPVREPLQESFWRPPLNTSMSKQMQVLLEVEEELARDLREMPLGTDQEIRDTEDGLQLVEVTVRNDQSLIDWLLVNGQRCRVIEPAELSRSIRALLSKALDYQSRARERREAEAARQRVKEFSTSYFWITPYNQILPIHRPHWSDILRDPEKFELKDLAAGRPIHELDKQELLDWAIKLHWVAISRVGNHWLVQARTIDQVIVGLVAEWAGKMTRLELLDESAIMRLAADEEKTIKVSSLLKGAGLQ